MKFTNEDDGKNGRISMELDGVDAGHLTFVWVADDRFVVDEVYTDEKLRGRGLAKKLVEQIAEYARERGAKIIPVCPYAKYVMERNRSFKDVLS